MGLQNILGSRNIVVALPDSVEAMVTSLLYHYFVNVLSYLAIVISSVLVIFFAKMLKATYFDADHALQYRCTMCRLTM